MLLEPKCMRILYLKWTLYGEYNITYVVLYHVIVSDVCRALRCASVHAVGGIYTVIRTKAGRTWEEWGDQYILLGPYNASSCRTEVEVSIDDSIMPRAIREVLGAMRWNGVKVRLNCLCD